MRFKKGSKVEVTNKEFPASWRVAEIISGNGHAYNVRYNGCEGVEKVSRRFIRPSPPAIGSRSWVTGDIVEVFNENSWKTATVSKILKGGRFLVRPHGATHELSVYKTNIRGRQSWRDGQWILIGKISGSYGDVNFGEAVEPNHSRKKHMEEDDDAKLHESYMVSKTLKRSSPFCSSLLEAYPQKSKKVKRDEKDYSQRHVSGHSFEKVDAFAYPGDNNTPGNNSLNGYYKMEKRKTNVVGYGLARIPEPNDSDYDQCSVGSCSVPSEGLHNNDNNKMSSHYDEVHSDAESKSYNTSDDKVAVSIHKLELYAYRSTLGALYASGPLSWEKEALLTNLRINLHISNDEHLTELRNLISCGAGNLD